VSLDIKLDTKLYHSRKTS